MTVITWIQYILLPLCTSEMSVFGYFLYEVWTDKAISLHVIESEAPNTVNKQKQTQQIGATHRGSHSQHLYWVSLSMELGNLMWKWLFLYYFFQKFQQSLHSKAGSVLRWKELHARWVTNEKRYHLRIVFPMLFYKARILLISQNAFLLLQSHCNKIAIYCHVFARKAF